MTMTSAASTPIASPIASCCSGGTHFSWWHRSGGLIERLYKDPCRQGDNGQPGGSVAAFVTTYPLWAGGSLRAALEGAGLRSR